MFPHIGPLKAVFLPRDAFFIMCPDPGHGGGGGKGGMTAPNCLEASQIGTPGQKKIDIGTLGQQ